MHASALKCATPARSYPKQRAMRLPRCATVWRATALPLLSLLQAEPLELQSSHLSFQEYFAACAICEEGTVLSGSPPWQWPAWWANALAIGEEMGEPFATGLVRAARIDTGQVLNLSEKLGWRSADGAASGQDAVWAADLVGRVQEPARCGSGQGAGRRRYSYALADGGTLKSSPWTQAHYLPGIP